jgi:mannose-6-phosphate isomerase-like protein (cupin superfamily)
MFTILEGEVEMTFSRNKFVVRAGETVNIPSNAPHQFHNSSSEHVRLLCLFSPAGQENFFVQVGVPVKTRTTPCSPTELEYLKIKEVK